MTRNSHTYRLIQPPNTLKHTHPPTPTGSSSLLRVTYRKKSSTPARNEMDARFPCPWPLARAFSCSISLAVASVVV